MIKFFKNIIIFFALALLIGEVVVRITHSVSDIPRRRIDKAGIQKYYPNQDGYWKGGEHTWLINEYGWPGIAPKSFNNLITVIGDSYIENFMNPNECHQAVFLENNADEYNFFEAGRSGVSLIEAMEISKQLDSLKPVKHLIYVNSNDFYESIVEIKKLSDITQLDLTNNEIIYGQMKAPFVKKILYNWKLMYYFYNRFYSSLVSKKTKEVEKEKTSELDRGIKYNNELLNLLEFIKNKYQLNNKVLVFHPNANQHILELCMKLDFEIIVLDSSKDKSWSFEYDSHWTCYGHERAAIQVTNYLKRRFKR